MLPFKNPLYASCNQRDLNRCGYRCKKDDLPKAVPENLDAECPPSLEQVQDLVKKISKQPESRQANGEMTEESTGASPSESASAPRTIKNAEKQRRNQEVSPLNHSSESNQADEFAATEKSSPEKSPPTRIRD